DKEKKKKESILDLSKYIDKTIRVKFQGGREESQALAHTPEGHLGSSLETYLPQCSHLSP
ncbi:LOW QUALITY PROTEIN: LSM7 isoform 5, partial [Pongo abelii]